MYFVYVLKSDKDEKLYVGLSKNLQARVRAHNYGKVRATRSRRPLRLVYFEEAADLSAARRKEKYFKSGFGRKYIIRKILALSSNG